MPLYMILEHLIVSRCANKKVLSVLVLSLSLAAYGQGDNMRTLQNLHQRVHGDFKGDYNTGTDLQKLQHAATHDVTVTGFGRNAYEGRPYRVPAYPPWEISAASCSDLVIVGIIGPQTSEISTNNQFLFTDVELTVDQVLKDNSRSHVNEGDSITITRPGGTIIGNGHQLSAVDPGFKAFRTGDKYLLFLDYLPETGAYRATARKSFQLAEEKLFPVASASDLKGSSAASAISSSRDAIRLAQEKGTCGGEK
jgi:hypothetical protein